MAKQPKTTANTKSVRPVLISDMADTDSFETHQKKLFWSFASSDQSQVQLRLTGRLLWPLSRAFYLSCQSRHKRKREREREIDRDTSKSVRACVNRKDSFGKDLRKRALWVCARERAVRESESFLWVRDSRYEVVRCQVPTAQLEERKAMLLPPPLQCLDAFFLLLLLWDWSFSTQAKQRCWSKSRTRQKPINLLPFPKQMQLVFQNQGVMLKIYSLDLYFNTS